ncbi:YesL family protein [Pseudalkalibacillus sp. R45]|uniref:YesL family protein n=1 Tax=Pseudalkalibacillus sp. R45 TaxID=3457433 RepID=UPI003FCE2741
MEAGWIGNLYRFSYWLTKFIYLNVLWILSATLGLFVLGFFPATAAMFTVTRKWLSEESDLPIWKTFWAAYKKDFLRSNLFGYILCIIGAIFYLDLSIVRDTSNHFLQLTYYPLLVVIFIYLLTCLYVFPVFVHFESRLLHMLRNAVLIMIMNPLISILMAIAALGMYGLTFFMPIFIPLIGGSGTAFILTWYSHYAFRKIQKRKKRSMNAGAYTDKEAMGR